MSHRSSLATRCLGALLALLVAGCAHAAPSVTPRSTPAVATAVAAPAATPQTALAAPVSQRDERWRADLRYLATELPARHANAYAHVTPEAFARAVAQADAAIPTLTDAQIRWRLMRLTALLRDGHTSAQMPPYAQRLPFTTLWTDAGPYIVGVAVGHESLRGRRIASVNGYPIAAVADTIRLYLPNENEMSFRARAGLILHYPGALRDVGLGDDSTRAALELVDAAGRHELVDVPVVPRAGLTISPTDAPPALYQQRNDEKFWFTYLPDSRTLYVQYNQCRDAEPFRALSDSVARVLDTGRPARVVVDLRANTGGDSRVVEPLVEALRTRPAVNRADALYVVIGRTTFSSGLMAAVELRRRTHATLIGEPAGERPNSYGEVKRFPLPESGIQISYSTRFFRLVDGDPDALHPDVNAPPTPDAVIAGRDPVMEWIVGRKRR